MNRKKPQDFIGFPPPLLGATPLRLPVLGEGDGWLALHKPAGVGTREYPWDPAVPNLDTALNTQLQAGKPELLAHGATVFGSIYYLDPEIDGVAVFAKDRDGLAAMRNLFGSRGMRFEFLFIARAHADFKPGAASRMEAPLLPHNTKPKMIPSSAKGKRTHTAFQLLAVAGAWALWRAEADYLRPHQIRAHAALLGVPVLGDELYGGPESPLLSELLPKRRGPGVHTPAFLGMALHLARVGFSCPGSGEAVSIEAALPRAYSTLMQRMGLSVDAADTMA